MFVEINRRLRGVNPLLPEYPILYDRIETDICMEWCITKAPEKWYGKENKEIILLDNFYGDESEFVEVRDELKVFLRQFQKPETDSEVLPATRGTEKVENTASVSKPDADEKHRGNDSNSDGLDRNSGTDRQGTDNV